MTQSTTNRDYEWLDYYSEFQDYFCAEAVREGCYPRRMEHADPQENAIVLVHGLSDSPHFMRAIADYFFQELGYNVYIPLLHCHGLKGPQGMEGVSREEWKKNVQFAVDTAHKTADQVSIGGLSTGGTLGFYMAASYPETINGSLYLFSAALDLLVKLGQADLGDVAEQGLQYLPNLVNFLDCTKNRENPLIGKNPFRYDYVDLGAARELAILIEETDQLLNGFSGEQPFTKRVFAAHSEADSTANIQGIEDFQKQSIQTQFKFYRIEQGVNVNHASLVLKDAIYAMDAVANDLPLEVANPLFQEMMEAIKVFVHSEFI